MNEIVHPAAFAAHPVIPHRPSIALVVADDGVGKTSLLCQIAAVKSKAGKRVLYVVGEGNPQEDIAPMIVAAGGDMRFVTLIDCEVEHAEVRLAGMLEHDAIKPHLDKVDCIILEMLSSFESEAIKRYQIRLRLKQFHAKVREGVTVFIAAHPNRARTNVRKPADRVPAGWGGAVEIIWMIEPSDDKGHNVLEMVRGRHYEKPWTRYPYWVGNKDGVKLAVIDVEGKNTGKTIAQLLQDKAPNYVPPSVAKARKWLLDYLAEHGERLAETEVFPDGDVAGHSEPAMVKAKAISPEIGHTPQGTGPSKWFLIDKPDDSVESVSRKAVEQNQENRPVEQKTCPYTDEKIMRAVHAVFGVAALDAASPVVPVHVKCERHYAIERGEDGLKLSWAIPDDGRSYVWLNGPWDAPKGEPAPNPLWAAKLISELEARNVPRAVTLWPYSPDTDWYKGLCPGVPGGREIRITRKGLKFGDAKNGPSTNLRVLAFLLFGCTAAEVAALREALTRHGVDVVPLPNDPAAAPATTAPDQLDAETDEPVAAIKAERAAP